MGELVVAARYWCHMCATAVNPVGAEIKCPYCSSGFLEEMETARSSMVVSTGPGHAHAHGGGGAAYPAADNAISIWAPIIDSMVGGGGGDHPVVRRGRRGGSNRRGAVDAAMAAEDDLDSVDFSRRRRRATAFLRLLQAIRERQLQRLESLGGAHGLEAADHYGGGPFGGGRSMFAGAGGPVAVGEHGMGMALGDYFLGPGLDALMQQLAENDAGRQGTPPAKKEAVEALPTVEVVGAGAADDDGGGAATCAVCLDDYAHGECARELPCRHRFHSKCILPWLQMHSSCPVCRFQLPADDDHKTSCNSNGSGSNSSYVTFVSGDVSDNGSANETGDGGGAEAEDAGNDEAAERDGGVELEGAEGNVSRLPASIQWLNSLFTQQGQGPGPSPPSTSAAGSSSRQFEED